MLRNLTIVCGTLAIVLIGSELAFADWPTYDNGQTDPHAIQRGPGQYFSIVKLICFLCVLFAWVKAADWINRDVQEVGESVGIPANVWNPVTVGSFLVGFIALLYIPLFVAGFVILLLAFLGPLIAYVVTRNGKVRPEEKVFTPDHLKSVVSGLGKKKKEDRRAPHEMGAPVVLKSLTGDEQQQQGHTIAARQDEFFVSVKELVHDALSRRATKALLDFGRDAVAVKFRIDGVWHNLDNRDRESSDLMLAVLKKLVGANPAERRAKQAGKFFAQIEGGDKFNCDFVSQGVQTGERVIIDFANKKLEINSLEEAGMREKMREQLGGLLKGPGMFVFSSMPEGGLSTTWRVGLDSTDRLMRDFMCIEDKAKPETDVQNIEVHAFDGAAGETPLSILPKLMLRQPEVLVLPDIVNGETAKYLCDQVTQEDRFVVVSVRAKEAVEALLRILLLKVPAKDFAPAVTGVVCQRLVRKLCNDCKQPYEPPPQLLQRLGIPQGRVKELYREYQPPPPGEEPQKKKGEPEVCQTCGGIGYHGRTAIYELLEVNDTIRQVLLKQPKLDVLRQYARKTGNRTLQEEGILLVATGVTSIQELQRALSQ